MVAQRLALRLSCAALVAFLIGGTPVLLAGPAPAPLLLAPANGSAQVDPDLTFTWRWIDDLIVNGNFEAGMTPGWYTGGADSTIWQIYKTPTNQWATTLIPNSSASSGQLIQDVTIPADATSATLQWRERVWNLIPTLRIGRFRVLLYKDGGAVANLEDVSGSEPLLRSHTWVTRSTNLLAYAGSSLQIVVQADTYSPAAVNSWFADVDDFSLTCEHSATPQFQVYVDRNPALLATDQVGSTTNLSFASVALDPSSTYYWMVAAIRDGVVNYSATNRFTTGPRLLPQLSVVGLTDTTVRLQFLSRTNRYYTIEELDALSTSGTWSDATGTSPGTGTFMQMEVLRPWGGIGFWRLRLSP